MSDKRVRTGCITCRRRRIKCDEQKPICNRCLNANFQCEGYATPRRLSHSSSKSVALRSKHGSTSPASQSSSASPPESNSFPEISLRHKDWRREQLPLYHHFVTTTVVRLFRKDHVAFWRDDVVQMSHGMDLVYEALLAIGAVHRSSLIACQAGNGPQARRFKLLAFESYGRVVRLLPSHLDSHTIPDILASLVVLMLLAYFECFLDNPKAAFRHLWAAILLFRHSENRFSIEEMSQVVPIFDAMLRLDFLAQVTVPYAGSSFLRCSSEALSESPFWNRQDPVFPRVTQLDLVAAEHYRLIQLVSAHNKLTGIVWAFWSPTNARASRESIMGFYDELSLWKTTSPATFAPYDPSSEMGFFVEIEINDALSLKAYDLPLDHQQTAAFPDPQPYFFASNEAAVNAAMCNIYQASAAYMIAVTDDNPSQRDLEVFDLIYQNLRIAAGLIERHKYWANAPTPYKPCDAVSMGITTFLFQGARMCFSRSWQKWTIDALRKIGREGLSSGHTSANAIEILILLETQIGSNSELKGDDEYLGSGSERLTPLLIPHGESDVYQAFYLQHGQARYGDGRDEGIGAVAKASWRQEADGTMYSLKIERNYVLGGDEEYARLQGCDLFRSWRSEVENGWHGFLSKEVCDGILVNGHPPMAMV